MLKRGVSDKDVSIVVQGPIIGETEKSDRCTYHLLESIRRCFPQAQIILSTWTGEDVSGLDYDLLVQSDQPKSVQIYYSGRLHLFTVNHQILSTYKGLKRADRKYAIKVRSDLVFHNNSILLYLDKYKQAGMAFGDWKLFSSRLITLPTYNFRRGMSFPFSVADWIYAGRLTDMLDFFDIPLLDMSGLVMRQTEKYPYLSDNIGAEQYNCVSFIRKHKLQFDFWGWESKDERYQKLSEVFYGQNFVFLPAKRMGVSSQKIGAAGYCAIPVLSSGLYTFCEWKRLFNHYGGGKLCFSYNPIEDIVYKIVYGMRRIVKKHFKELYAAGINKIRKMRR